MTNNLFHNHTSSHRSWTLSRRVVFWLRPPCGPASSVSQLASFPRFTEMSLWDTQILQVLIVSSTRPRQKTKVQQFCVVFSRVLIFDCRCHDLTVHHTPDVYLRAFVSRMPCLKRSSVVRFAVVWSSNSTWAEFSEQVSIRQLTAATKALARIVFQSPVEMHNHMVHFSPMVMLTRKNFHLNCLTCHLSALRVMVVR